MDGRKCHDCDYRKDEWREQNCWCYMFKEQPTFTKCHHKVVKGKKIKPKMKPIWKDLWGV